MMLPKFITENFDEPLQDVAFRTIYKSDYWIEMFSSITIENFYVIDVFEKRICYIRPGDFFLCGYSAEEALTSGYYFFKKVVHPDDLLTLKKMHTAILQHFNNNKEKCDLIDYFSCKFRLQHKYSFLPRLLSQMVYQQMKPVRINDELHYLICFVKSSTIKGTENLRMHFKTELAFEEFNLITHRWKKIFIKPLTERERAILMLAQQGNNAKEIADGLCKGYNTIRNQIKEIFTKLNVHSMQEAIEFACISGLMYAGCGIQMPSIEIPRKRTRILLTNDKKQFIQQHLDAGKSIRHTAILEGVAESAIRYAIKQGKITNKKS